MSSIDINIAESRSANSALSPIRNDIDSIITRLSNLQRAIDPRILNQRNLRGRISNSRNSAASIGDDLQNLQATIASILSRYEQTEQDLLSRVPKLTLD